MKVAILYNQVRPDASPDEADVLVQVEAVAAALASRGHAVDRQACGLDLQAVADGLAVRRADLVFNLAEGLAGHDRLFAVIPSLLDSLGIPYTGCPAEAIFLTTNKLLAKDRLSAAGLPTPAVPCRWPPAGGGQLPPFTPGRYIVKPVWEHGSVGMNDDAIFEATERATLAARLRALGERTGRGWFAERYVEGREINLSLLAAADGPQVLPPAEIDFSAFPPGKPRIVGYAAKWDEGSFEYHHTPRRFDLPPEDAPLLARVAELGRACWHLFGLAGYARVDFRVDAAGEPWVLEINTNPCLSPDAGFAAALARAGISYPDAIGRIVEAAIAPAVAASPA
jgi:D-alanine-D-alanine ligase